MVHTALWTIPFKCSSLRFTWTKSIQNDTKDLMDQRLRYQPTQLPRNATHAIWLPCQQLRHSHPSCHEHATPAPQQCHFSATWTKTCHVSTGMNSPVAPILSSESLALIHAHERYGSSRTNPSILGESPRHDIHEGTTALDGLPPTWRRELIGDALPVAHKREKPHISFKTQNEHTRM